MIILSVEMLNYRYLTLMVKYKVSKLPVIKC